MNYSTIIYLTIVILFLIFTKFYNYKNFFLLFLLFIIFLFIKIFYNSYVLNFFSYDVWKISLISILIINFLFLINIIKDFRFEVLFLYSMVFLGSIIIILCDNFIIIYLGLELQTFSLFLLISKNKFSIRGAESALKYFILGSLSSGLFLLGVTFIFSSGLSINIKDLYVLYNNSNFLITISLFLIAVSLFFKLALFPFHFWVPDIYEGSSLEVLSLMATLPKISVISIILQILTNSSIIVMFSVCSIIIGTMGAINQTKIKRLIAYSGISHMGFIILGFVIMSKQSFESSFIYLLIYTINMLGVFFLLYKIVPTKNYFIIELGGLNTINKIYGLTWLILILSIGGVPPLSGFISKLVILNTLINYNYVFVALVGILFSAISIGYYLRIVKIIYFQKFTSYLSWKIILNKEVNYTNNIVDYLLGFILYFNIILILNPSVIFIPFYLSFNYYF